MGTSLFLLVAVVCAVLGTGAVLLFAWRSADDASRGLIKQIAKLPLRQELRLARSLFGDSRIPLAVRLLPPALVLYLAMPLDLIPDFVPVLGQLDDVLIAAAGIVLLLRFAPRSILEDHLNALEPTGP